MDIVASIYLLSDTGVYKNFLNTLRFKVVLYGELLMEATYN